MVKSRARPTTTPNLPRAAEMAHKVSPCPETVDCLLRLAVPLIVWKCLVPVREQSNPWKKSTAKMRWKWKKKTKATAA